MQLTHSADDYLAGFLVFLPGKGRVFPGQNLQGPGELVVVAHSLGLDGHGDDRIRETHLLQGNLKALQGYRVPGLSEFETDNHADVTGLQNAQVLGAVGVHPQDAVDPLALFLSDVHHRLALFKGAAVDANEAQGAGFLFIGDLENQPGKRAFFVVWKSCGALFLDQGRGNRRNLVRRGQVVDHSVQDALDAYVAKRRTDEHRQQVPGKCALSQGAAYQGRVDALAGEVELHDGVVHRRYLVDEFVIPLAGGVLHIGGDRAGYDVLTLIRRVEGEHFVFKQVDHAAKVALAADGDEQRDGIDRQLCPDFVQDAVKVGTQAVHLVDVGYSGDMVLVGLFPHRLALRLHSAYGAEDSHCPVQDPQRPLDLGGEIHVARSVDDVDLMAPPETGRRGALDGDSPVLLLLQKVHRRLAAVDLSYAVVLTGVVEDALGGGRLAGVDMGDDSNVSRDFRVHLLLRKGFAFPRNSITTLWAFQQHRPERPMKCFHAKAIHVRISIACFYPRACRSTQTAHFTAESQPLWRIYGHFER